MPFNVHLADNEDPMIEAKSPERRSSQSWAEFTQGIVLGLLFVAAAIAVYWFVTDQMQRFPDFQSFANYWFSYRGIN